MDALLGFGTLMMRAGNTAARTREWIGAIARKMGFDAISVSLSLDSITASVRSSGERITAMREIGPPGINAWRIAELEQLAKKPGSHAESKSPKARRHRTGQTALLERADLRGLGMASAAFAFLNGAAAPEMISASNRWRDWPVFRAWLSRQRVNQYGAAALSAIAASGIYVLAAALARHAGLGFLHYPSGFIASVLFLIPGFPLIAALFDLLQHQTVAAISRFAYGAMLLLAVALGLSIVIEVGNVDITRQPPLDLAYPLKVLLRAIASFVAACAFAMLFNTPVRAVAHWRAFWHW